MQYYYVSACYYICVLIQPYMFPYTTICVLIVLYMCPHTTIHVSSNCHMYVSSYNYVCVLILLYMRLLTVPGTFINQFAMDEFLYAIYLLYQYKSKNSDTASSQCLGPLSISLLWTSLRATFVSPPPTARCAPLLRLFSGSIQALFRLYSDSIQALFRLYSGSIQALLRPLSCRQAVTDDHMCACSALIEP